VPGSDNPVWTRRIASVAMMFAGALLGAWLWHVSAVWPLALGATVSAACGLAMSAGRASRTIVLTTTTE
jgi:hypothetical protein